MKSKESPCSSMVEQRPPKPKVEGSIPFMDAFYNIYGVRRQRAREEETQTKSRLYFRTSDDRYHD